MINWFQHLTPDTQLAILTVLACSLMALRIYDMLVRSKEGEKED